MTDPIQRDTPHMPIAREGFLYIGSLLIVAVLLGMVTPIFGVLGGVVLAGVALFFRDPPRVVPDGAGLVVAPCDGTVIAIADDTTPEPAAPMPATRVSIHIGLFDPHVIRTPVAGELVAERYKPGTFLPPTLDKSSLTNERHTFVVKNNGAELAFTLVAGSFLRRIVAYVGVGQGLARGERVGMIRFGSRVDVYLPKGADPAVQLGQTTVAGETVLATLR